MKPEKLAEATRNKGPARQGRMDWDIPRKG